MIEADFQREYGINLVTASEDMSWRRFLVLLRNLSANSLLAMSIRTEKGNKLNEPEPLEGEEAVIAVKQMLGPRK